METREVLMWKEARFHGKTSCGRAASGYNWECSRCKCVNGGRDDKCNECGLHRFGDRRNQPRKSSCGRRGGSGVKYDWDSVSQRQTSTTEFDDPSERKCVARRRHDQVCPPGPTRTDRNTCQRSLSPTDRKYQTPASGRTRDKPLTHDSVYNMRRGSEDSIRSRDSETLSRSSRSSNDSPPGPGNPSYPRSGNPSYPRSGNPPYPRSGNPSYPRSGSPPYPRSGNPSYPRSGSPPYPRSGNPSYPRSGSPPYPRSGNPSYPRSGSPPYPRSGNPPYPRSGSPSYPRSGNPSYPRSGNGRKPVWDDCVDSNERRLVLLGKTGCGKSATGNTILSGDFFRSKVSGVSVTRSCRRGVTQRNGREIHVVDTPGVFDTDVDNETTTQEIVKCIGMTAPGPHAFIVVVSVGRFTAEERDSVEHFINHFGKSVQKYMIVLFTRMDALHDENLTLDDHLKGIPSSLASVLERCGGRCIGFNNKGNERETSRQVDELMEMVEVLFKTNHGRFYTNNMYMEAENVIRIREAELRSVAVEQKHRDMEEIKGDNETRYKRLIEKYENEQRELEKTLLEAESKNHSDGPDGRIRADEIGTEIHAIRTRIDQDRRAGRKVNPRLEDKLSSLEKERNSIVRMQDNVVKMRSDIKSLREQVESMKRKVLSTKREQNDDKERRLRELEKKYAATENVTREIVRKEVEKGETNFGDQLLATVIGIGKAVWKGLTKFF
ncbi:uncharacterized protein LOC132563671 [Ylistrum balloti]|uniref:uncharacterized protein LOC132563671 n=1 Tax=Ylistrum balloti TaxID=509963 RepID=UPI002905E8C8|nr:uncharacterized protein LOC132563671 [Ylistrum balloti]